MSISQRVLMARITSVTVEVSVATPKSGSIDCELSMHKVPLKTDRICGEGMLGTPE